MEKQGNSAHAIRALETTKAHDHIARGYDMWWH